MTKSEIIALQTSLRDQGFPVVIDGIYGPKTEAAYAKYLDRDTNVPTVIPAANRPLWKRKTAIFAVTTVLVSLAGLWDIQIDSQTLTETLTALATLVSGGLTLWANGRSRTAVFRGVDTPGLRLKTPGGVPAKSQSDPGSTPGPFGY